MKKQFKLISRLAVVAVSAAALCFAGGAFGQESRGEQHQESESSMAGVGVKPRKPRPGTTPAPAAAANAAATAATQLSAKDKDFMMTAAKGSMMEVHMGQMAEKQGQSDEVKKLGKQMVADHTKANNQLMGLAQKKGVKLDTSHKMAKMDSANFDQAWLAQMVKDHEKMVSAFQAEAKGGTDPDVKSWAGNTVPTLQKHLKMLKDAQGKMAKKAS